MIYLEIKGRLGNQFFRYAFARVLQVKRGDKDKLVLGLSNMNGKSKMMVGLIPFLILMLSHMIFQKRD